ncbi:hypothetical protein ON010_g1539 [Phytophthora cinnamomi]|nr:hypothetical protein ON010_g1539 [Phytophthora cinnamomi]
MIIALKGPSPKIPGHFAAVGRYSAAIGQRQAYDAIVAPAYSVYNTMADFLANQAMDSRRSQQQQLIRVLGFASKWDSLYAYAIGDVGLWMEQNTDENSSGFVVFPP